jgi:hypothetical protein
MRHIWEHNVLIISKKQTPNNHNKIVPFYAFLIYFSNFVSKAAHHVAVNVEPLPDNDINIC